MSNIMDEARKAAGFRELYAIQNGNKTPIYINGNLCYKFTYNPKRQYQDANGAIYDTVRKAWID